MKGGTVELETALYSLPKPLVSHMPTGRNKPDRPCPSRESALTLGFDPCPRRPLPASLAWSLGGNSLNAFRGFPPGEGIESDSHWAGAHLGVTSAGWSHREGR